MRFITKLFKRLIWTIVILLIIANVFIVVTGRFYLYKGIAYTYLSGETGPTIYDLEKFPNARIKKSVTPVDWRLSPYFNKVKLTNSQEKYFENLETKAILVFQNNHILYERYWDDHTSSTLSNSFSAAKTVVSLLVGIAIDQNKIKSLDDKVGEYLPAFNSNGKEKITIRHLLMMSSGLDWEESGKNPLSDNAASYYGENLYDLVMDQNAIETPGKRFNYQSGNSQLLGYIVETATGLSLNEYAQQNIWSKIGTKEDAYWSLDSKDGDEKAFCCMYASPRDFGRLGKLISQHGKWGDKQIISEKYIKEMFQNPVMETEYTKDNYQYGLHIWTYLGDDNPIYYCRGILGQYVISIPDENIVIVRLGSKRGKTVTIDKLKENSLEKQYKAGHPEDFFELVSFGQKVVKELKK
jgi:CubicO group peptidase (beta-lactamase class C family)